MHIRRDLPRSIFTSLNPIVFLTFSDGLYCHDPVPGLGIFFYSLHIVFLIASQILTNDLCWKKLRNYFIYLNNIIHHFRQLFYT